MYEPCFDAFRDVERIIGDDGITMTNLPDSPLHRIFVSLMGYERGSLAFADEPAIIDDLAQAILRKNEEAYRLAAASPAEVLLTGENTNADFESPALSRRYAFPTFCRASEVAHAAGKLSWIHACGKLKVLLPQFLEAGIDGVESLTPPPYADTPLWEARRAWQGRITIDGGISPHLLVGDLEDRALRSYVLDLFSRMGDGRNFVLSVSDDTPTDAFIERLVRVGDLAREHGRLPLG
jgi:uroporphyrinogen-III decarboxylase